MLKKKAVIRKNKKKEKTNPICDLFDIIEIFVICTACIVVIFSLIVRMTIVDGESMENTLLDGQYLLVRDFLYTPERGDIVVVNDPSNQGIYSEPLVKRVIAVAGDTVEISGGALYLNGELITEDYIKEPMRDSTNLVPTTVGEHQVFVMGDNRNASGDSRVFGAVDERCIIGKAFLRVLPFDTFTYLENPVK
ncbi:MAG: signal peptidase I [Clostridia bacterium]|nr:signal peptidase I [Clostridia bacterium]